MTTRNAFHSPTGRSAFSEGLALALLVVVEAAGARGIGRRVPDLDLGRAAEVEAAVAALLDLPVDEELEVGVVGRGAEALALAVEDEDAVDDPPMGPHPLVGLGLGLGQLGGRHLGPGRRVGDEPFPAVERAAVEERREAALAQAGPDELADTRPLGRIDGPGLDAAENGVRLVAREPAFLRAPARRPVRAVRPPPSRRGRDCPDTGRGGAATRARGRPRRRRRRASCRRRRTAGREGSRRARSCAAPPCWPGRRDGRSRRRPAAGGACWRSSSRCGGARSAAA